MMTKEQYNIESGRIEYAVQAYMQMDPSLSDAEIVYDGQENEWIVQITASKDTAIQFKAKTAVELKAQILADMFTALQYN
jgi:hypothetical protein